MRAAIQGRIADADRRGRGRGERSGEDQRHRAAVTLDHLPIANRDRGQRDRRRRGVERRLPFRPGAGIEGDDIAHLELAEPDAGQGVGLLVAVDGDDRRAIHLGQGEFSRLEPAEIELVRRRVEIEHRAGTVEPVDGEGRPRLARGGLAAAGAGRPIGRPGNRHALRHHQAVRHDGEAELEMDAILAHLGGVEDEIVDGQRGLGHAQQDQRLAGAGIGDHHAFRAVGHVDLFARAVVAEVHHIGRRVEGDLVDLPEFVGPRIDGVRRLGDPLLPGQRTAQALPQVVVDDRHEAVDRQLAERHALHDDRLARPGIHEAHAGRRIDHDEVVDRDITQVEFVMRRVEADNVGTGGIDGEDTTCGRGGGLRHVRHSPAGRLGAPMNRPSIASGILPMIVPPARNR